ncbi:unnamed protein product [Caenorhabditis sp. 36 PRJEB53466]|nr:unnamed protein product [Caenorhabditis sp. 36 PRJEB53466]
MFPILVVFLSISTVIQSADPKCPEGFTLFKRVPTANNNFTKEWCMIVIKNKEWSGNRDKARSICIYYNSSLTIPENQQEADFLTKDVNLTYTNRVAVDGEFIPKCKALASRATKSVNFMNSTGDCAVKNKLFAFEDENTDTTFIKSQFKFVPNFSGESWSNGSKMPFIYVASCASLYKQEWYNSTRTFAELSDCSQMDKRNSKEQLVQSVACGRPPL